MIGLDTAIWMLVAVQRPSRSTTWMLIALGAGLRTATSIRIASGMAQLNRTREWTPSYGKASFDFAKDKPLELLSCANLLYLLKEHAGVDAKIKPPEHWVEPKDDTGPAHWEDIVEYERETT